MHDCVHLFQLAFKHAFIAAFYTVSLFKSKDDPGGVCVKELLFFAWSILRSQGNNIVIFNISILRVVKYTVK